MNVNLCLGSLKLIAQKCRNNLHKGKAFRTLGKREGRTNPTHKNPITVLNTYTPPQDRERATIDSRSQLTSEAIARLHDSFERQLELTEELIRENQELKKKLFERHDSTPLDLPDLLRRAYNAGATAQYDMIPAEVDVEIDEWAGNLEISGTVSHELYIDEVQMQPQDCRDIERLQNEVINDAKTDEAYRLQREKQEAEDKAKKEKEEFYEAALKPTIAPDGSDIKPEEQTS